MSRTIHTSKKSTITADVFLPKMTLTLTFINGKEIVVDATTLSEEVRNAALMLPLFRAVRIHSSRHPLTTNTTP
jgi:hypothetical protein